MCSEIYIFRSWFGAVGIMSVIAAMRVARKKRPGQALPHVEYCGRTSRGVKGFLYCCGAQNARMGRA